MDLFVRSTNTVAVNMYKQLGYVIYRRVLGYYEETVDQKKEDAFDMRKSLSKDPERKCMIPLEKPI